MIGPSSVRCGRCGSESKEGSLHCHVCGAPLTIPTMSDCPRCGLRSSGSGNYCTNCGSHLAAQPDRRSRGGRTLAVIIAVAAAAVVIIMLVNGASPALGPIAAPDYAMGTGTVEYSWDHDGRTYRLQVNLTEAEYQRYRQDGIQRQAYSFTDMIRLSDSYVTPEDAVILQVAASFERTASELGLDRVETVELVLSFVQTIDYLEDNETTMRNEYWRYPVETLYDRVGDCEDKVFLFASIVEAMGYDAVVLFFEGHAAGGIDLDGVRGAHFELDGIDYYYCETTSYGWRIGDHPEEYTRGYVAQVG